MSSIGAASGFVIELCRGPADGARLLIAIEFPPVWEVGSVPLKILPGVKPGTVVQVPIGQIKVHRYVRTDDFAGDGLARIYVFDRTFP